MQPVSPISTPSSLVAELPPAPALCLPCPHDAPFPSKLYDMLEHCERSGLSDVVSWLPHGRAFKILDADRFMDEVAGLFFRATKLRSVQRQLNLWGFTRVPTGEERDSWYHPFFLRDRPAEMCRMVRTKVKNGGARSRSEPNGDQPTALMPNLNHSSSALSPAQSASFLKDLDDDFERIKDMIGGDEALSRALMPLRNRTRRVSVSSSSPSPSKDVMPRPEVVASASSRRFSAPPATITLVRHDRYREGAESAADAPADLPSLPMDLLPPFGSDGEQQSVGSDPSGVDEFSLFIDKMLPEPIDQSIQDPF